MIRFCKLVVSATIAAAVVNAIGQNRLADPSFEDQPLHDYAKVRDNFITGVWGTEVSQIVGPVFGLDPHDGKKMLQVNQAFQVSQTIQYVDVSDAAELIDSGKAYADYRVWATMSIPGFWIGGSLRFYSAPGYSNLIDTVYHGRDLDGDLSTWELHQWLLPISVGTRILEWDMYMPGDGLEEPGYMDDAYFGVVAEPTGVVVLALGLFAMAAVRLGPWENCRIRLLVVDRVFMSRFRAERS